MIKNSKFKKSHRRLSEDKYRAIKRHLYLSEERWKTGQHNYKKSPKESRLRHEAYKYYKLKGNVVYR